MACWLIGLFCSPLSELVYGLPSLMLPNVRHKKSLIELPGLVMLDHALSLGFVRQMLTSSLIFVPVLLERCEVRPNIGGTFLRLHNFKRQL